MSWKGERQRHAMSARGIQSQYTPDEIKIANRTSRTSPNKKSGPGTMAIVPRMVLAEATPEDTILDFGAGKYPKYAIELQDMGYNVTAYEFGDNHNPKYHDINALNRKYDIVYASNVLNVQSSKNMLLYTLNQIRNSTKHGGIVVLNYPKKPRKSDLTTKEVEEILNEYFNIIVYDNKNHAYIGRHIYGTLGSEGWNQYNRMQEQGKRYEQTGNINSLRGDSRLDSLTINTHRTV